ncbi:serine/threonine-protein kinase [Fodinibius sp.]|uniref:serine/threonine-protein kinase n=1 Tax=Fodinibius sp. TaxID=1872440 RepID=UPI002ACE4F11|nr:serine/threonine-protein kinase [Fodinibius sp.]MDZ7657898.1 serine/threonine-protein kinase [Fodinibius sp.]
MEQHQWKKVNKIVDTALELDEQERATYIEESCKNDEKLKRHVTKLLAAIKQSETEDFLATPDTYFENIAGEISPANAPDASSMVGQQVGNYSLHELIGHGGMGSVFKGKRADEAYEKEVAIKILRRGMDTPSNIARFKRERNILANLEHPNVARLLDGGLTKEGLPYLVMEYVDGTPLLEHCNQNNLTLKERLELFEQVCFAVQHAHKNAIIHRDLKPSNILVTKDGKVKVLDFGIAKLIKMDGSEGITFQTRTGSRMLTWGYAAPEQVTGETVTTATDSYVLGILLYELLTGVHPYKIDDKSFIELEKQIREQQSESPSTQFSELSVSKKNTIAKERKTTTNKLSSALKGDLDAIIMKALRKESDKRYSSAEQLLEDLNRRKTNLPILAREDTFRYNASKFIKRHRTNLSAAAGFLLLLIGFTIFYTWQITQERNRAQLEAQKAKEVSTFLTDMFRASNPNYNPQDTVTAATFLKRGQERIDQLEGQPEVQAQLLEVMGRAYTEIGQFDKANPLLQKSLQLRKTHQGTTSIAYSQSLDAFVVFQRLKGNFAEAESLTRESISIIRNNHPNNKKLLSNGLNELGLMLDQRGKYEKADSVYKTVLQIQQQLYESSHPKLAHTLNNRAGVLRKQGQYEKAENLYRRSLTIWKEKNGDIHPSTAMGYHDLALVLNQQGKLEEADSLYHKGLKIDKQLYDPPNRNIAQSYNNIGIFYGKQGQYQEAKPYLTKALAMRRKLFTESHPKLAEILNNLGRLHIELGNYGKAHPYLQEALKIDRKNFGQKHPYVAGDLANLARIEKENGSLNMAEKHLQKSLSIFRATLPSDHRKIADILTELGDLLVFQNNPTEAVSLLKEALTIKNKSYDERSWQIAYTKSLLGNALAKNMEFKKAESYLVQGYETLKEERGSSDNFTTQARNNVIELYKNWNKPKMIQKYSSAK